MLKNVIAISIRFSETTENPQHFGRKTGSISSCGAPKFCKSSPAKKNERRVSIYSWNCSGTIGSIASCLETQRAQIKVYFLFLIEEKDSISSCPKVGRSNTPLETFVGKKGSMFSCSESLKLCIKNLLLRYFSERKTGQHFRLSVWSPYICTSKLSSEKHFGEKRAAFSPVLNTNLAHSNSPLEKSFGKKGQHFLLLGVSKSANQNFSFD